MQQFHSDPLIHGVGYPIIAVASTKFSKGDPLYIDSSGTLAIATAGSKVLGFCLEDVTTISTNVTGATNPQTTAPASAGYAPAWVPAVSGVRMRVTADQACTQTDIGAYADYVTLTSGAIVANLAAGSTGQLLVLGFDPDKDGSTTEIIVEVAEPQLLAFSQD